MVALGKWSQHDIDNIFLMKYDQGLSEPQITDHIAKNNPSHRNIKVTGVRYVLRCKQPSPGIPKDPKNKQTAPADTGSQYSIFKKNLPVPLEIQDGIMSQKRLQEQFLNRQNRLSNSTQRTPYQVQQDPQSIQLALPSLTSFQTSDHDDKDKGTTSLMNYEIMGGLNYADKDFLNSLPPRVTNKTQDNLIFFSGTAEDTSQDSNVCLPTRNSSVDSYLHSFHGSREDDLFSTPNRMNSSTNTQLLTPTTSQNIYQLTDMMNPSTDANIRNLTFYNEPIDDIFKEFPLMEQAEVQSMPGIVGSSFSQEPWAAPLKFYEQENEKNISSNNSDPNTYLEGMEIEKRHENTCHPIAPTHKRKYTNTLKSCGEKKGPSECLHKQKKLTSQNFEACSKKGNKFGGIRGSPLDNPQIMWENPISHLNSPNDSNYCDGQSINNKGPLKTATQSNDFLKSKESLLDLGTSTINLHNPEFHQPFILPTDTQFWSINKTGESNLTLHGSTSTSQMTINMFNPKFHSGCFIDEVYVPPNCTQEQLDTLRANSSLKLA